MFKKISFLIFSLLSPMLVFAYDNPKVEIIQKSTPLKTMIGNAVDWLVGLVGVAAVLFLVWGGFQYITSAGNKEKAEAAKKTITYAVGGLLVVILASIIVSLVMDISEVVTQN